MRFRALIAILGLTGLVGGCATTPTPPTTMPPSAETAAPAEVVRSDQRADVLYNILAGEMAGQTGQIDQALEYYLKAADSSGDPVLAERATRIAIFARHEQEALRAARRWAELAPDNLQAQQTVAVLLVRTGKTHEALSWFEKILNTPGQSEKDGYALIYELLSNEKDSANASVAATELAAAHPKSAYAQLMAARVQLDAGADQDALKHVQAALDLKPDLLDALILRARIYVELGQVDRGIRELKALVQRHPRDFHVRVSYARVLLSAKRYTAAEREFAEALKMRPKDGNLLLTLGLLNMERKHYKLAEGYLKRLVRVGDSHVTVATYYLGRIAEKQGKAEQAIAYYYKVVDGKYFLDAQLRIAGLLAKLGRIEQARATLARLRSLSANSEIQVRLYLAEGQLLREAGDYQAGMELFDEALRQFPDNNDLLYARALMAEKLGRIDWLERDLRSILKREPDNATALNALGYTLADRTDRYREAYKYISRALELRPNDPAILDSMGWVQYRLGHLEKAEKDLRKAYGMFDNPEVAAHLVEVLHAQGKRTEARKLLNQALAKTPDDHDLRRLKKALGL
ncbi:MAG: tetratricopeptide repeat protein [Gammaproteobacteria bacterium]